MWSPSFRVLLVGVLMAKLLLHHRQLCSVSSSSASFPPNCEQIEWLQMPCHLCEQVGGADVDEDMTLNYSFTDITGRHESPTNSGMDDAQVKRKPMTAASCDGKPNDIQACLYYNHRQPRSAVITSASPTDSNHCKI
ncbi:hypothetical protein KP509_05G077000 [Ceratopteris richardii]|uniref:Uncharacterized protein n=1 Tax=Ceratopteris richardii TaxID=49495 RepID=A0A8T2US06_CERRI|nr:hypothetical protein KP509_05G077000 [Ceratopteris richardii]